MADCPGFAARSGLMRGAAHGAIDDVDRGRRLHGCSKPAPARQQPPRAGNFEIRFPEAEAVLRPREPPADDVTTPQRREPATMPHTTAFARNQWYS